MPLRHSVLVLALFAAAAAAQPTVAGYTTQQMHGFDVLVLDSGTASHPADMQGALDELDTQLGQIVALGLPESVIGALRGVTVFVHWNTRVGAAQYHPSRQWLIDNGFEPEMAESVDISNAQNFAAWSRQNQPWMVFHELVHAYHHQVLGFDHPATLAAYHNAVDSGLLDSVPYNPGDGQPPFDQQAYAKNNEIEYLAEISEAFVGENDYFPFVRSDLETYDPQGYALVRAIWEAGLTNTGDPLSVAPFAVSPNPTVGAVVLDAGEPLAITVVDVVGRVIRTLDVAPGRTRLDLADLPAGLYVVRAVGARATVTRTVTLVR